MTRHSILKRIGIVLAAAFSAAMLVLLVLRSVYAISLFNTLTSRLQSSGWHDMEADSVMQTDEEMTFEAGYFFFKVGSVKFQVLGETMYDSLPAYRMRAYIDSYSGMPFVNFHAVYDTYADAKNLRCIFNSRDQKEGDIWVKTTTHCDMERKNIEWEQSEDGKLLKRVDMQCDTSYTNGVSFIYYLREACRNSGGRPLSLEIPIIDDTVRSKVDLTINEKREPCDVTAFDFPLDSQRLSGHIDFVGTFGVTGDFVGWMAADSSCLPLKAKVKVILGSVVVQLKEIKRGNWIPPRSVGNE
ncbi:MAG: DUF3108 domain-containing protein [Candidatus Kryptoniota bacterium]